MATGGRVLHHLEAILPDERNTTLFVGYQAAPRPMLGGGFTLDGHLNRIEKELVEGALETAAGDRGQACELLGITPRSLRYLIRKHGLPGVRG
jgi:metallo-beta-lactamase family protein